MRMKRRTISQEVIELLERHRETPLTPEEIAKLLGLKIRKDFPFTTYYWGKWNFWKAEKAGLIEWVKRSGKSGWILKRRTSDEDGNDRRN